MTIAGIPTMIGPYKVGALCLPVGAEGGSEKILKNIRYFRANVLGGTPSLIQYLIEKSPEVLNSPIGDLGIKIIMAAGEPGGGIPEVRQKIESSYKARLYDFGAALGVSCHHREYQGMHQVADDFMIVELVNPDTKEPLPFEHGQRGEALMTMIDGEGWAYWVRFAPGDIFEIYTEPCACGLSGFRYKVVGRTDDMLKVKGVMIYPSMVASVLGNFTPRITGQFRIVLDEPPPRVVPPLKLKIERGENTPREKLEELRAEIEETMSAKIKIRPAIQWLEPKELARSTYKGKVFEKSYEKK
jgi:phenylacetate-CoA ligase